MLTRSSIIRAAAAEFGRNGYHGTSLSRIGVSAGVSMGALAFHFPSKERIADAVRGDAVRITRRAVLRDNRPAPGLQTVIDLTHALVRLLENDPLVRGAARLAGDGPRTASDWYSCWEPILWERLSRARADHSVSLERDLAAIAALVQYMVAGTETVLRGREPAPTAQESASRHREQDGIWHLVLRALQTGTGLPPETPSP